MSSSSTRAAWQTMQILWGALCASHLILAGVLWFVRFGPDATPPEGTPPPLFLPLFGALAFGEGVASFLLPRFLFQQTLQKQNIRGAPSEEQLRRLLPAAQTTLILGMALCESISILGLVLGFLGAPPLHFAPFFAAGLLLALPRFPSEAWLRAQLSDVRTL
jgi:hypothetical protein